MDAPYSAMAPIYDAMNGELDYAAWADFIEAQFARFAKTKPELVLDLAAGTGSMTIELAKRGYDMTAVDLSGDMLSVAADRIAEEGLSGILLLEQDMTDFELYGTVDAVVCCLDSINHLTRRGELSRCFSLGHNYLNPDGLFLFDMNTPYKFEHTYGNNAYVLEDELVWEDGERSAIYCGWQNTYHPESGLCDFDLSLFEEDVDGRYRRSDEHQVERCYDLETVKALLADAGFELLGVFGGFDFSSPATDCERWYFAARAIKK